MTQHGTGAHSGTQSIISSTLQVLVQSDGVLWIKKNHVQLQLDVCVINMTVTWMLSCDLCVTSCLQQKASHYVSAAEGSRLLTERIRNAEPVGGNTQTKVEPVES